MSAASDLRAARARLAAAQAARERLLLGLERGEYVYKADVNAAISAALNRARDRLLATPSALAQELVGADEATAYKLLMERVEEALHELPDDIMSLMPRQGGAPAGGDAPPDDADVDQRPARTDRRAAAGRPAAAACGAAGPARRRRGTSSSGSTS